MKLPNIDKIARVKPTVIRNKACSLGPDAQVKTMLGLALQPVKREDDKGETNIKQVSKETPQQEGEMLLHTYQKRAGETPHTLHLTRRVQQDNLEGSRHRETTPQQVLSDEKGQQFNEKGEVARRRDESEQQTTPTHMDQCNDPVEPMEQWRSTQKEV